jgi:aminoglycoside phosphotransferase family enzyme
VPIALIADDAAARLRRARGKLFDARVRGGRIVEAHGDLRPEHVARARAAHRLPEFRRSALNGDNRSLPE